MDEVPGDAKGAGDDRVSLKGPRLIRGEREQARQQLALVSRRDPREGYPEILAPQCDSGNKGRALIDTGYVG